MNNVTLTGNVCRDFELRRTNNGTSVASNTIAVKRDRKEADGTYATDFFDIYLFGTQADFAVKWLRKGDKVAVTGSVHVRDYTTRNGSKGRAVEVSVNSIENLMPKDDEAETTDEPVVENTQTSSEEPAPKSTQDVIDELPDDDLPF